MNNLHLCVPTNDSVQILLPLPPYINPFLMQQLLVQHANTMPGVFNFYGFPVPFWSGTLYQHHQYWPYYRALSSGFCSMTEPQLSYNLKCESSGRIEGDHSTGIRPGHARIGANFNTGVGEVWRTPSKNPLLQLTAT